MAHNEGLLRRLCSTDETLTEAQTVYRLAQARTGPGSGFELGPFTTGLPAISAYIASKRLKNGEVTRQAAQVASCLKKADFEKAFYIVEAAVGGQRRRGGAEPAAELEVVVTYDVLIRRYRIPMVPERLLPWMARAEGRLLQVDQKYAALVREVKGAVFLWVCSAIKGKKLVTFQNFADDIQIPVKSLRVLYDALTASCATLKEDMLEDMRPKPKTQQQAPGQATAASGPSSPTKRSPSKKALRELPTKDRRRVAFSESEDLTSADLASADGFTTDGFTTDDAAMDVDVLPPQTPRHREASSPAKARQAGAHGGQQQQQKTPKSSSQMQVDSPQKSPRKKNPLPSLEQFLLAVKPSTLPTTPSRKGKHRAVMMPMVGGDGDSDADGRHGSGIGIGIGIKDRWLPPSPSKRKPKPRQRFRPAYVDHQQWLRLDPRVEKMTRQGEVHLRELLSGQGISLEQHVQRQLGIQ